MANNVSQLVRLLFLYIHSPTGLTLFGSFFITWPYFGDMRKYTISQFQLHVAQTFGKVFTVFASLVRESHF